MKNSLVKTETKKKKTINIIKRCVITSFLSALIFVLTFFLKIPYANGNGYFNIGDSIILFTSICIGPIEAIISGVIGSVIADLISGYSVFVPFTIIAKSLEAIILYFLFKVLKERKILKFIPFFIAPLFMVLTYFISYIVIYNIEYAMISMLFDLIQAVLSSILAILLYIALKKVPFIRNFNK